MNAFKSEWSMSVRDAWNNLPRHSRVRHTRANQEPASLDANERENVNLVGAPELV
jgi:hypothetical protein